MKIIHDLLPSCTFWSLLRKLMFNPNSWIGQCVSTYSELAGFSENTLSVKSASFWGSNVEGTMMYSPAGSRKRELTSRRLMKSSERALDPWDRKKSRFRWTPDFPTNWAQTHSVNSVSKVLLCGTPHYLSVQNLLSWVPGCGYVVAKVLWTVYGPFIGNF